MTVGQRIRAARKERRLTLTQLGEICEMTPSKLSRVENNQSPLNVDQILKISEALEIPFAMIAREESEQTTAGLRAVTKANKGRFFSAEHCNFEALCTTDPSLNSFFWQVEVKQRDGDELVYKSHPGVEFLFVLSGSVEVRFAADDGVKLSIGDAFKFDASKEHAYVNHSALSSRLLMVNMS